MVDPALPADVEPSETLVQIVARHWLIVIGSTVGLALAAAIISLRAPTLYEAGATILVLPSDTDPVIQAQAVTHARTILENRSTAAAVIKQLGLNQSPDSLDPQTFVQDRLMISQVRDTNYVRVTLLASTPRLAEDGLKALLDKASEISEQIGGQNEDVARSGAISTLLETARQNMARAGEKLLAFDKETQIDRLEKTLDRSLEDRERLNELDAEIAGEDMRVRLIERALAGKTPNFHASDATRGEASTAGSLKGGSASQRDDGLEDQLVSSQITASALREQRRVLAERSQAGSQAPLYEHRWRRRQLELDLTLATSVYTDLAERLRRLKESAVARTVRIVVVDRPLSRLTRVSPNVWLSAGIGGALGCVGAFLSLVGFAYAAGTPSRSHSN